VTFGHCEVDLFFVFSSRILGGNKTKQNKTKAAKVAIFTEFRIRSWRSPKKKKTKQDFMKFLFSRLAFSQFSPSYYFILFSFSFLFLFSKDFVLFLFFFSFFFPRTDSSQKS
jgi:hypothetical protein